MSKQQALPGALDILQLRILSTRLAREQEIHIEVESTCPTVACRQCGRSIDQFDGYEAPRRLDYMPPQGQPVAISIRLKRFRCPYCADHPTTIQQIDWSAAEAEGS